jgi:hypothetical protein
MLPLFAISKSPIVRIQLQQVSPLTDDYAKSLRPPAVNQFRLWRSVPAVHGCRSLDNRRSEWVSFLVTVSLQSLPPCPRGREPAIRNNRIQQNEPTWFLPHV